MGGRGEAHVCMSLAWSLNVSVFHYNILYPKKFIQCHQQHPFFYSCHQCLGHVACQSFPKQILVCLFIFVGGGGGV